MSVARSAWQSTHAIGPCLDAANAGASTADRRAVGALGVRIAVAGEAIVVGRRLRRRLTRARDAGRRRGGTRSSAGRETACASSAPNGAPLERYFFSDAMYATSASTSSFGSA